MIIRCVQAAFDELLDILRSNKLLPSINITVTDDHKGIATTLKASDDTQHIQHLDDPFHIGKNLKKNALKKLNHAARHAAKDTGLYTRQTRSGTQHYLPGKYTEKYTAVATYVKSYYFHQLEIAKQLYDTDDVALAAEYVYRSACLPLHLSNKHCPSICACRIANNTRRYKQLADALSYYTDLPDNAVYVEILNVIYNNHTQTHITHLHTQHTEKVWLDKRDPIENSILQEWEASIKNITINVRALHRYTSSACESLHSEIKSFISNRIEYWQHGIERMKYCILKHNYTVQGKLDQLYTQLLNKLNLPLNSSIVQQYIYKWTHTYNIVTYNKRKAQKQEYKQNNINKTKRQNIQNT